MRRVSQVMAVIFTLAVLSGCSSSVQQAAQRSGGSQYESKTDLDSVAATLASRLLNNLKVKDRATIAVIDFPDANGNISELSQYLSENLISRLVMSGKFSVIERKLLGKIIEEHKLNMQGLIDGNTAKQIGKISGVTYLVSGTIIDMVKNVNVNARLISTETGAIVAVAPAQIRKDEVVEKLLLKNVAGTTGTPGSATSDKAPEFSPWLSGSDYQKEFDQQVRQGNYPSRVEGSNEKGLSQFRASFVPNQPGVFFFYSHHGIDKTYYDGRNAELSSQGYKQVFLQTFIDGTGTERYQATWIKTQQGQIARKVRKASSESRKEKVVFEERYQDNQNGWSVGDWDSAAASITDGQYVIRMKAQAPIFYSKVNVVVDQAKDFSVEATVAKLKGADENLSYYGIIFGKDFPDMYEFLVHPNGKCMIRYLRNGNTTFIQPSASSAHVQKGNAANTLRISKEGEYLKFYLNGQYVTQDRPKEPVPNAFLIGYEVWRTEGEKLVIAGKQVTVSQSEPAPQYTITANRSWQDTVQVRAGQVITINASGAWNHGESGYGAYGPEGCAKTDNGVILPSAPVGVLIARINNQAPIIIGAGKTFTADSDGILQLSMNDWGFENNTGSVKVQMDIK